MAMDLHTSQAAALITAMVVVTVVDMDAMVVVDIIKLHLEEQLLLKNKNEYC